MDHNERRVNGRDHGGDKDKGLGMYIRFGAMILTAMVVMYAAMFVSAYEWSHIRFSVSRMFMALTMGGTMGLIMLAWMLNMYKNSKGNLVIVAVSVLLLAVGTYLDRSQTTVQDTEFMTAMIPHHSMAITRAERSELADFRVCELAVAISEAQRREILEMSWLVDDIRTNGVAGTSDEATDRPIPDFDRPAERVCPPGRKATDPHDASWALRVRAPRAGRQDGTEPQLRLGTMRSLVTATDSVARRLARG